MTTNTLLDWFTVFAVLALFVAPSLAGHLQDRRIDRQLKAVERRPLGTDARVHVFAARRSAERSAHSKAA